MNHHVNNVKYVGWMLEVMQYYAYAISVTI